MSTPEDQLAAIAVMDKDDLKDRWAVLTGLPVPRVSTAMLRLALAHELQNRLLGGLSRKARRQLDGAGDEGGTVTRAIRPGMRLAREHGGTMHVVTIGDDGSVIWNDRTWRSLSEVARAITGTRWSGPAFFGLKQKRVAA